MLWPLFHFSRGRMAACIAGNSYWANTDVLCIPQSVLLTCVLSWTLGGQPYGA